ncbi:heavy metal translocating P-type ATPase [Desulfohalobium retbaense]|uniref:P-type Zn(2+) transporter n=1 Tax=Desulfohalobium retbaense (strain ATCC 49708 / DSM 5692 / JCM 16813 / HR100) TaxID=485915 RepID=C8X548_DESRD|nr:heavy metal translocating P-type ATPase [Desulfohalobium retbaense]ACV69545.1 heavy metal translocating P-type ATPase [Desulfohalobium retbaense DSM 5692]
MHNIEEACPTGASCGCSHCGASGPEKEGLRQELRQILPAAAVFAVALTARLAHLEPDWLWVVALLGSYVWIGREILAATWRNIRQGKIFDELFLMSLATLGAIGIGAYGEAVGVMLFYRIGEALQDAAVDSSRRSIQGLLALRPDVAAVQREGSFVQVDPASVQVGELIRVRPGERVPLDGEVAEGSASLDTADLTGEPLPRFVEPGESVLAGMVNQSGVLHVRVIRAAHQSTVARILELVQGAGQKKAEIEQFITVFARYYTPIVVCAALAVALAPPLLSRLPLAASWFAAPLSFSEWIYRGLIFLVVSCPCALVLSIPLTFFAGIGAASRRGILIKGANFLEGLSRVQTILWDKTGTLTSGAFAVSEILTEKGWSREAVLEYAALAEMHSSHPVAVAVREAYAGQLNEEAVTTYEEHSGLGVQARVNASLVVVGRNQLLAGKGIAIPEPRRRGSGTRLHVAIDGDYAGTLVITDTVRRDSAAAITRLREAGVREQHMLTGDAEATAWDVAQGLGLDQVHARLLPQDKVGVVERFLEKSRSGSRVVFVGDGLNDAPVLTRADIGVAMGGASGLDAAIEAADVVLMEATPSKMAEAIRLAKRTRRVVWENIGLALGIKGVVLVLGAVGLANMWGAIFADVGAALLAVVNSLKVLRFRE